MASLPIHLPKWTSHLSNKDSHYISCHSKYD
nr:MAG TPA: hypothetical protein [Bacteriophage sp.]DAW65948.1 MAG TPA: hypothetical protein [Bacteriophage sp.]